MREVQRPGDRAEVVWAITRVIVLRSDPPPKQEVNVDRSRKCPVFLPYKTERPINGKSSADEGGLAMEPLLLKAGDVAKLLGLGRSKVFAMLAVGELPVIRIGRSVRVPRAALEDWIAEHTQHASGRSGDAGPGSFRYRQRTQPLREIIGVDGPVRDLKSRFERFADPLKPLHRVPAI